MLPCHDQPLSADAIRIPRTSENELGQHLQLFTKYLKNVVILEIKAWIGLFAVMLYDYFSCFVLPCLLELMFELFISPNHYIL